MKTYLVVWTYIANYGKHVVQAKSQEDAANIVYSFYASNPQFKARATLYISEFFNTLIYQEGVEVRP